MDKQTKAVPITTAERPYLRGLAVAAIVLVIIALLPVVFMHVVRIIDALLPHGISQSQDYALLLPVIIFNLLMVTVVPLTAITALIFALVAFFKSKASARKIATVALILIACGVIMTLPLLRGFKSILFS